MIWEDQETKPENELTWKKQEIFLVVFVLRTRQIENSRLKAENIFGVFLFNKTLTLKKA
jgi:hypothetical protein